jgi:EmrB/QacA subfamily drug resistance transporter
VAAPTDRLLLANAIMGQFLTGVATRIFIISLPTLASALNTDLLAISWAVIVYQLAGISLSVVFGRLGDIHGRHVIYGLGFAIMTVSSLLCGLASNAIQLILFRFIQGLGAAMISSATRVLAMEAMPEGSEGRANGYMTMGFHSGLLLGPPLGGFVIDLVSWRWIFFLLVPMGLVGVVLTVMRARGRRRTPTERTPPIDYLGAALLIALTALLTLLLDRRSAETIGAERTGVMALVFGATLLGFLAHERRAVNPVMNLALFRIRMFTFSILSLLLIATTHSVLGLLMPFYIQDVLHFSPSLMGLIFLAAPVFTIGLATASGQLTDRIGPRAPTSIGVLATMAAFAIGLFLRIDSHWLLPALMMALMGVGSGFFNTANQAAIIGSVPREYRGFATGMVQTIFGVAALLGISLGGALLTLAFRHYSGLADAAPSAADPRAFVASMNVTYLACLVLMAVALGASFMRGGTKIEAATSLDPSLSR